jgi:hypothetical protein
MRVVRSCSDIDVAGLSAADGEAQRAASIAGVARPHGPTRRRRLANLCVRPTGLSAARDAFDARVLPYDGDACLGPP